MILRTISAFAGWRMGFAVVFGVALFIANVIVTPSFVSGGQLAVTAGTLAPFVLAAMASTPAFLSGNGGIDLSVTPLMALSNIVLVTGLLGTTLGQPELAIPLLLVMGAIVGAANGIIIARLRFPPVIATLGMFFMLSGLDLALVPNPVTAPHAWIDSLADTIGPIPGALLTIGVPLLAWGLLRRTPLVAKILSVGDNGAAAFSAGVRVDAVRIIAYTIGGLLAALGGIALSGLIQSADTTSYTGYTVAALAAVALGGTNLAGGSGGLLASAVGATCIYLLDNLLGGLSVSSDYVQVAYGAVLVVALVLGTTLIGRSRAVPGVTPATVTAPEASSVDDSMPPADGRSLRARRLRHLAEDTPVLQLVVLAVVFVIAATTIDGFLAKASLFSVLVLAAFLGIASAGQTLVILIGGLDLSVASIIGAADLVTPILIGSHWSPALAIIVVITLSAVVGAVNGFIAGRFRVSPLIVTLAVGGIVYGLALAGANAGQKPGIVPMWLTRFSSPIGTTFGIGVPPVVIAWTALAVLLGVALHRTATGRRVYATGANARAADLVGISTLRVWIGAFALSGAVAGAAGVLLDGFISAASTGAGSPYMFTSLAAVVVGGTSLVGARGDYWRTVLGALILTLITTILVGHGAGQALEEAAYGFLILVFVGVYGRERRFRDQV